MRSVCKINIPRQHKTNTRKDGGSVKTRERNKYSKGYSVKTGSRLIQGMNRNPNYQPLSKSTIPTHEERFLSGRGSWLKKRCSAWRTLSFILNVTSLRRHFPTYLLSLSISAYSPKPQYPFFYIIPLNITTHGVLHPSPSTSSP